MAQPASQPTGAETIGPMVNGSAPLFGNETSGVDGLDHEADRMDHHQDSESSPDEEEDEDSDGADEDSDDSDDASEASEDDTDYRYVRPRGGLEQVMIQHMLVWAREDFWEYIDEYVRIETSLELSYIEQYQEMQAFFVNEWARRGKPGKAPFLKCFAAWTGDLGNWNATRLEEQ